MKKFLTVLLICAITFLSCFAFSGCFDDSGDAGDNSDSSGKGNAVLKAVPVSLSSEEYAFAVKKGDTELKKSVNDFLKDKKTEIDAIFEKYTAENVDLNDSSKFGDGTIKTEPSGADNELVVATNLDFAPFEYMIGNKIAGIDMEIAKLLATYLDKTLVVVNMQFEAVVTSVSTVDTYDIGIAGLTITPERQESVDFSDAYFGATQMLVVKESDKTFDGLTTKEQVEEKLASLSGNAAKCGGQKGTTSQFYIEGSEDFGFDGFQNLMFSGYSGAAQAVADMLNGNLAFVVVDKETANALVASYNA